MHHPVPLPPSPLLHLGRTRTGTRARRAAAWRRARAVLFGLLVEAGRYACGCPRSRLHQRAALRELDDRLLRDIGAAPGGTQDEPRTCRVRSWRRC